MEFSENDDVVIRGRNYGQVISIDGDLVTILTHDHLVIHVQTKDVLGVLPRLPGLGTFPT